MLRLLNPVGIRRSYTHTRILPHITVVSSSRPLSSQAIMTAKDIVEEAITKNKVAIFSKSWCPYCAKAKATLAELVDAADIEVLELDKREDGSAIQQYLLDKTNQRTVPNVFVSQTHVGGNDDVQAAKSSGKLQKLISPQTA